MVQFLVLVPYLRATGYRYRPRFDFRGSGLGHTLRLGVWTVLFVVVNQVAYTVVVRLASHGTVGGESGGAGYTIYANAFLLTMVPHAIITVSLATAMLPLLSSYAARGDLPAVGRAVSSTLRSAYALIVPAAAFLAVMALDTAHIVWAYGSAGTTSAPSRRRWPSSGSAWCSSRCTTCCCAGSTPWSRTGWSSSSSAASRRPTSSPPSC